MVTALIITRAVHISASMLLAGTFTFDLIMLGLTDRSVSNDLNDVERRLIHLAFWSLIAALLSALLWLWLEVASMSELSLKNAVSATAWGTVLFETQFGRVWQLRLGLTATAFVLVLAALAVVQFKARRADRGSLAGKRYSSGVAGIDQPRSGSHSGSIRCVERHAPPLRGGLVDRWTGAADDFPLAHA